MSLIPPGTRAVIFDLDGTLYAQPKLRRYVFLLLIQHILLQPQNIRDIYILYTFRKIRERHAGEVVPNLEEKQYAWVEEQTTIPRAHVKKVVEHWMHEVPLSYLERCKPKKLADAMQKLKSTGIRIGVFSDYPVAAKLATLGLTADATAHATEQNVDALKPHPRSLETVRAALHVPNEACVVVGNRESRDGDAARALDIQYVHVDNPERFFSALASE